MMINTYVELKNIPYLNIVFQIGLKRRHDVGLEKVWIITL